MTISTYALLIAAIADFLNRPDMAAKAPTFIELAEASFKRREEFQDEFHGTLTLSGPTTVLPDDVREITSLYLDTQAVRGPVEIVSPEHLSIRKSLFGYQGIPQLAAISSNGTELLVAPEPNATFVGRIVYLLKLTPLSTTATSNWLLVDHPDIYLYGALLESAPYLKDDGRVATWEKRLEKACSELWAMTERRRFSPNTPIQRPRQAIG